MPCMVISTEKNSLSKQKEQSRTRGFEAFRIKNWSTVSSFWFSHITDICTLVFTVFRLKSEFFLPDIRRISGVQRSLYGTHRLVILLPRILVSCSLTGWVPELQNRRGREYDAVALAQYSLRIEAKFNCGLASAVTCQAR